MNNNQKKAARQKQIQTIKDVLTEFDIQTQINKLVHKSFNDLLRQNKQAFQYIQQNDKKITLFQTRLLKIEQFSQTIQNNVANKLETMTNLANRLDLFAKQFHENNMQNLKMNQLMRKDYDQLNTNTQKNTFQIRNIGDLIVKFQTQIKTNNENTTQQLQKMRNGILQNQLKIQKQLIQMRQQNQNLSIGLASARAQLSSKSTIYQQVSKDIQFYKHQKQIINNRINDLLSQLKTKASILQFNQMRLSFDSQMVTEKEYNSERFNQIRVGLKDEISNRKADTMGIRKDHQAQWKAQWKIQDQYNKQTICKIDRNYDNLKQQIVQTNQKIQQIQSSLKSQISNLDKRQKANNISVIKTSNALQKRIEQNLSKILSNQKILNSKCDQIAQMTSNIQSMNQSITKIIQQNQQRKKEMKKAGLGLNANQILANVNQEMVQLKKQINNLSSIIQTLKLNNNNLTEQINRTQTKLIENITSQRVQFNNKYIQINRRINQVSIQIMNNINKIQTQTKSYINQFKAQISGQIQNIKQMRNKISQLQMNFQKKMLQSQQINRSMADKMEKTNMGVTKFKSDVIIKMQSIMNQQQRRSIEVRELSKVFQEAKKLLGYLTQSTQMILAILIHRQTSQQNQVNKEPVKMSSLNQGWVLQIQDKMSKYRGDILQRKRMAIVCLNSLINYGDKIKGSLIQSGKDIYHRMYDQIQQVFTTKKRAKSILNKIVPQLLPKLHF